MGRLDTDWSGFFILLRFTARSRSMDVMPYPGTPMPGFGKLSKLVGTLCLYDMKRFGEVGQVSRVTPNFLRAFLHVCLLCNALQHVTAPDRVKMQLVVPLVVITMQSPPLAPNWPDTSSALSRLDAIKPSTQGFGNSNAIVTSWQARPAFGGVYLHSGPRG